MTPEQTRTLIPLVALGPPGAAEGLALLVLAAATVFAGPRIAGIWAGRRRTEDFVPAWWVWGTHSWRGLVRASPSFYLSSVLLLAAFVVAMVHNALDRRSAWVEWLGRATLGAFVASLVLSACVIAFNRPRALVPPRFRGE
jgi:hypothetical protein